MFQILDTATLFRLLDAAPEAVFHTIETGAWSGGVWPGNAEWDLHEACAQVRSLTLHYVTVRHPDADRSRYEMMTQVLASQACPQGGAAHLESEFLVQQAMLWLWVLAGGPEPPRDGQQEVEVSLPGGDPVAFTETALALLDGLLFVGEEAAEQVASTFLQEHRDEAALRALELVAAMTREASARTIDTDTACSVCGAEDLEFWYSGQTWGETLCEPCYEVRVEEGQARSDC